MTQDTVARYLYAEEACAKGDPSVYAEVLDEEFFVENRGAWSEPYTVEGIDGYAKHAKRLDAAFSVFEKSNEDCVDLGGGRVLRTFTLRTVDRATGEEQIRDIGQLWRMRDGKVLQGITFETQQDARDAARGL